MSTVPPLDGRFISTFSWYRHTSIFVTDDFAALLHDITHYDAEYIDGQYDFTDAWAKVHTFYARIIANKDGYGYILIWFPDTIESAWDFDSVNKPISNRAIEKIFTDAGYANFEPETLYFFDFTYGDANIVQWFGFTLVGRCPKDWQSNLKNFTFTIPFPYSDLYCCCLRHYDVITASYATYWISVNGIRVSGVTYDRAAGNNIQIVVDIYEYLNPQGQSNSTVLGCARNINGNGYAAGVIVAYME